MKTPPFRACLTYTEAETSQSLLNTEYDQLIDGEDANSSDSEDYGLTSYQQPPPQEPLRGKNEAKKKNLKRKASEVPTTTTAKIKKTEDSIKTSQKPFGKEHLSEAT